MSRTLPVRLSKEVDEKLKEDAKDSGVSQSKLLQNAYLNQGRDHVDLDQALSDLMGNLVTKIDVQLGQIIHKEYLSFRKYRQLKLILRVVVNMRFCKLYLKHLDNGSKDETLFQLWSSMSRTLLFLDDWVPNDLIDNYNNYLIEWEDIINKCPAKGYISKKLKDGMLTDVRVVQRYFDVLNPNLIDTIKEFQAGVTIRKKIGGIKG